MTTQNGFFLPENLNEWLGYKNLRIGRSIEAQRIAANLEKLWSLWKPYSDPDFQIACQESEEKFNQRFWEMYLGAKLLEQGKTISSENFGPDICLIQEGKQIWIEAIAPSKGQQGNPNSVPIPFYEEMEFCPDTGEATPLSGRGSILSVVENPIRLRYLSAIKDKYCCRDNKKKRRGIIPYIAKGNIGKNDPVIIAVNSGNISQESTGLMPVIIKTCFGFGDYQIHLAHNRQNNEIETRGGSYTRHEVATKITQENSQLEINSAIFLTPKYPYISAILFSYAKLGSVSCDGESINGEFMLIHNPFAKNPLSRGLILGCKDI